jgi:hypothetical protein
MWQSNVPLPPGFEGLSTCDLIFVTTGAPKVMLGTKWPSITSTCSQSQPLLIVVEHASPRAAKSAERIDGAMMAGGDMATERNISVEGTRLQVAPVRTDRVFTFSRTFFHIRMTHSGAVNGLRASAG